MADQKVSDLPSLNGADVDAADLLYIIDSSAGTAGSKKITVGQYQLAPYSAGTANGVMYLNGSNVVTTGSGLTFDGTNLGVGTTSPGAKLEVASGKVLLSNAQAYAIKTASGASNDVVSLTSGNVLVLGGGGATDSVQFWNQGLERMRLDASGNLLVGTTNSANNAGVGIKAIPSATAPYHSVVGSSSSNTDLCYLLFSTGAAAFRFYVGYGGTVYATSTTITGISDQRLKENIRDLDDGLNAVMALQPRKFDWKAGKGKDIKNDRGFIAQEFEQVFPDMIDEWKDPAPEGEAPYKAVNANLIPTLVKAIQEQQAIINDLRARVAALEAQ